MKKLLFPFFVFILAWNQVGFARSSRPDPCQGPFPSKLQKACRKVKQAEDLPMDFRLDEEDVFVQDTIDALKMIIHWEDEDIFQEKATSQIILERLFQMGSQQTKAYALWGMAENVFVDRDLFERYANQFSRKKSMVTRVGGDRGCGRVRTAVKEIVEEIKRVRERNEKFWNATA